MRLGQKLILGAAAGVGAVWAGKQWLHAQRRIELADRVVVITGSSTGHGLVAARLAARQGARLVLAARDAETLSAARDELARETGAEVLAVPTDVSDPSQCNHLIESTLTRLGPIDVLVNNAGIINVGPVETQTLDDFRTVLATNFWGAVQCTLAALPAMRARGFGRIANVISVGGLMPVPHLAAYTASKYALAGFTKALRLELARDGILMTGVYPPTMRTGGHTHAWFKGAHAAEYAWFGAGDSIPLLSVSAETVASALWRAVCDGDAEARVGWQNWLAPLESLMPNVTAEALALLNRAIPRGDDHPAAHVAIQGQSLTGRIPDLLQRAVPEATRPDGVA
jgi:NAD(P)-dependent dehydrogenase (short-subunit alcohol dehydrogenase family)